MEKVGGQRIFDFRANCLTICTNFIDTYSVRSSMYHDILNSFDINNLCEPLTLFFFTGDIACFTTPSAKYPVMRSQCCAHIDNNLYWKGKVNK